MRTVYFVLFHLVEDHFIKSSLRCQYERKNGYGKQCFIVVYGPACFFKRETSKKKKRSKLKLLFFLFSFIAFVSMSHYGICLPVSSYRWIVRVVRFEFMPIQIGW